MKIYFALILLPLLLSGCGGAGAPASQVSRVETPYPQGMKYEEFRKHSFNDGSDMDVVQKRFLLLDRDNNGVLSASEFSD